jgi:acetyl-CoA C-acetyltransferase
MNSNRTNDVFIFDLLRTAVAPAGGALSEVLGSRLVGALLRELGARGVGDALDALVLGGDGASETPRHALASAGMVARAGAWQLQHGGVSSMGALRQAAMAVALGDHGLVISGGYQVATAQRATTALDMLIEVAHPVLPARAAADMAAHLHGVHSEELDAWLARSQQALRNAAAGDIGTMRPVHDINGLVILAQDRLDGAVEPDDDDPKNFAALAATHLNPGLPPMPRLHQAAHLAPAVDGACLLVLGRAEAGARCGLQPRARVCASVAVAGGAVQGPAAVITAVQRALQQAGWTVDELDCLEIHDAVAVAAPLASGGLGISVDRVNRMGGALVRGDMGAAAGAACVVRLVSELERSGTRRGVAAIADAAGHAIAVAIERRAAA